MMNNELTIFENSEFGQMRTLFKDGEPWFVAADVCRALEISQPTRACERLDDDEKGMSSIHTPGGLQELLIINEPGLYGLVLGSRKPEAKRFKRWITHEVLPALRKTGSYSLLRNSANVSPELKLLAEAVENLMVTQERVALVEQKADATIDKVDKIAEAFDTTNENLNTVMDAFSNDETWRKDCNEKVNEIVYTRMHNEPNIDWGAVRKEIYREVEARGRFNLSNRLTRMKRNATAKGASKTAVKNINYMDVIESDPRLKQIFNAVLRERYLRYCVKSNTKLYLCK